MRTKENKTLVMSFVILISFIAIIGIIGYFILSPSELILQGEVEVTVSGKVPGRVLKLLYKEGDKVNQGDTLVWIDAPEVLAKEDQAAAAESAAQAISDKAKNGTRKETIQGAYEQYTRAKAASDYATKSYNRMKNLYSKGG